MLLRTHVHFHHIKNSTSVYRGFASFSRLDFRNMDCESIATHLDSIEWRVFFSGCSNVDNMYTEFVACCQFLIDHFVPCFPKEDRRSSSKGLKRHIESLKKRLAQDRDPDDLLSKRLKKAALRLRSLEEQKLDFKDARSFFRYSNSRLKGHEPIPTLCSTTRVVVSSHEKGDLLADHFASVYNPGCEKPLPAYLTDGESKPAIPVPDQTPEFSEEVVHHYLESLPSKSSMTPERIPPVFYKTFRLFLSEPLAMIYNRSYQDGTVPELFRVGIVTPVHKKGPKNLAANYRPVSQCCIACLIFEKIMALHITHHLSRNGLLDENQHGFVPRRSTCTQLLTMTQDYAMYLNQKTPFHAIYFDFKAAFDKIDHELLLTKMAITGIHEKTVDWCRSYLQNRTFRVRVADSLTNPRSAPS